MVEKIIEKEKVCIRVEEVNTKINKIKTETESRDSKKNKENNRQKSQNATKK